MLAACGGRVCCGAHMCRRDWRRWRGRMRGLELNGRGPHERAERNGRGPHEGVERNGRGAA
eukprot:366320-Chlamydomonas_euryale.AAC.8